MKRPPVYRRHSRFHLETEATAATVAKWPTFPVRTTPWKVGLRTKSSSRNGSERISRKWLLRWVTCPTSLRDHVPVSYRKRGRQVGNIAAAITRLLASHRDTPLWEFDGPALAKFRDSLVGQPDRRCRRQRKVLSRQYIGKVVRIIQRMFARAREQRIIEAVQLQDLLMVRGLQQGRSDASEAGAVGFNVDDIFRAASYGKSFNQTMLPCWNRAIWSGIQLEAEWIRTGDFAKRSTVRQAAIDPDNPKPPPFDPRRSDSGPTPESERVLKTRSAGVWNQVGASTRKVLGRTIRRGIKEGLSFDQMQEQLQKAIKDYTEAEARRVARTEVTASIGNGGQIEQNGSCP